MTLSDYAKILVDSMFTLAPVGHNPESFRIFEAIEAGSIPIIALDDTYRKKNATECPNSLGPLIKDSPLVFLNDWSELEDFLVEILSDKEKLNAKQKEMKQWYKTWAQKHVHALEQLFLADQPIPERQ